MSTLKFWVENPSFLVYTDKSKNADFINNGFFAEDMQHANIVAKALIEFNYGVEHALNSDWYVSDGNNECLCNNSGPYYAD